MSRIRLSEIPELLPYLTDEEQRRVDLLLGLQIYEPRGACAELQDRTDKEILIAGPAGTGKSRACLQKLHSICSTHRGIRALIARKTRESLSESALLTFERHVLGPEHPLIAEGGRRNFRHVYTYPNGSEIVVGGMDKASRIMSTEYDLVYIQEATELFEDDWESLTSRLRNGALSYQQLMADCNPGPPTHWLKLRCDANATVMLRSVHEDNPQLHDGADWTPFGREYIATLEKLTGVRHLRLRKGIWAAAEGTVYEFNPSVHLIDRFEIPAEWRRIRVIDFGYTNPFVCFDDQTEVLTSQGWLKFDQLLTSLPVATINPLSHRLEWQLPTDYIEQWYDGPMIVSEPREQGANFAVTPNHRMVVTNRKSDIWRLETASRLRELGDSAIPTGWDSDEIDDANEPMLLPHPRKGGKDLRTTRGAFARFLGLWLADGCLYEQHVKSTGDRRYLVRIAQKFAPQAVRDILTALSVTWTEHRNKNGVVDFKVQNIALYRFLEKCCGHHRSANKSIPTLAFTWGTVSLRMLLEGLMLGDGRHTTRDIDGRVVATATYFTTSKRLADDVQVLGCLLGMATRIQVEQGKTPFSPNGTTIYKIRFHVAKRATICKLPLETREYHGFVRCVTVPNGMIVVRRGGRPMVGGNCQWWAVDPDGRMYRYREIYMTQRIAEDHGNLINKLSEGERIEATIADHDAEDRATLMRKCGIVTKPADKAISPGIQAVELRMRIIGDNKPRIFFLRDSLVERDERLVEAKLPWCTEQEFDSYVWPRAADGRVTKEAPVKENDHGMDCMRYIVKYVDRGKRDVRVW